MQWTVLKDFHELADRVDSFPAEYRIVRPDGQVLWLAGRGLVVARHPDGRAARLVSVMADVSERKRDEDILRVERERLSLALEAGRMGVCESSLRILIVDDNRDAADSLSEMLELMGNETGCFYDGQEGVDAALEFEPDVVLLDIGLPDMSGYEACRRIRQQPEGGQAMLIAITGWGAAEDRRRSKEAGFDHHMIKPVDPEGLIAILRKGGASPYDAGNRSLGK